MAGRKPHNLDGCQRVYPVAIEQARWAAKLCGYAVGVHGSQTYDLDLIAVAWTEDATPAHVVAEVIAWATDTWITSGPDDKRLRPKPYGRLCWTMFWVTAEEGYDHLHIDLSVIPPRGNDAGINCGDVDLTG